MQAEWELLPSCGNMRSCVLWEDRVLEHPAIDLCMDAGA